LQLLNTLRVISSNVDSLTNKLLETQVLLKEEAADIAGLVEILPKYTAVPSTESSLQISGFQCFTNLGQPNCRRGVGVYRPKIRLEKEKHYLIPLQCSPNIG
jgi:exonuclease III